MKRVRDGATGRHRASAKQSAEGTNALPTGADLPLSDLKELQLPKLLDGMPDPRARQFLTEFLSALGLIPIPPGDRRPAWAIRAIQEGCRCWGVPFGDLSGRSENERVGLAIGMFCALQQSETGFSDASIKLAGPMGRLIPTLRTGIANESPEQAAEFFKAQQSGRQRASRIHQPPQRVGILMVIGAAWRVIAEFKSTRELYGWLVARKVIHPPGAYTGKGGTDPREIRKVCELIGLKFSAHTSAAGGGRRSCGKGRP